MNALRGFVAGGMMSDSAIASAQQAADEVIHKELEALHGGGGVIAVAPDGQMAWSFNTSGRFRAL